MQYRVCAPWRPYGATPRSVVGHFPPGHICVQAKHRRSCQCGRGCLCLLPRQMWTMKKCKVRGISQTKTTSGCCTGLR